MHFTFCRLNTGSKGSADANYLIQAPMDSIIRKVLHNNMVESSFYHSFQDAWMKTNNLSNQAYYFWTYKIIQEQEIGCKVNIKADRRDALLQNQKMSLIKVAWYLLRVRNIYSRPPSESWGP